ncbi:MULTISPECIES: aminotransferase class IV [Chryseobacterium]|uniref:Branched-subunit amino acid aminotransferase/4-amino-4-deoxychorismate lyase n=1 Tax=Chryseobacterium camelliae TaxID=1265445 RepID=A0ABU0TJY7_9FLAO|nr:MULTISPECIES: aminotransferase class IV [Chryseobacterium]MDT3408799.1 branched-subunit amino acid aminotransferase/4-amino-4-deoxychorismate lyase [Pseudacidovorax intermedius]MDQ1097346.1 branched-subunit amino acid aminotransferase/4-amino-4-deoxychorismate lyase [Chryseobacterium camelliae]MDQ1101277.1 branched-subunit amino acid aminotransferase/4-amino-4-deoxychorismate lyase [Chryseobacterium sp. SORGH_AS_1048]MDR6084722.1 branched-subunit amino acid aminotransferase/4-amino-4-deoxych
MDNQYFTSGELKTRNRAFLMGDAVKVSFFIRNAQLIMDEECYFFLMASMRKMRMNIPLTYTLEFFQNLFRNEVIEGKGIHNGIINFQVFRNQDETMLANASVSYFYEAEQKDAVSIQPRLLELDLIKEINVNNNLLSNIRVHCPENIYGEIYAQENDLDDVILLNPNKRIARTTSGNLLFLEGDSIKIPKHSEGAYISPLLENLVTFLHKNNLADIQEHEIIAFESQKAEEILLVSDEKGLFSVGKIRNKTFGNERFTDMVERWKNHF